MQATYKVASRMLEIVMKYLPRESQPWGAAMRRELDFIEGNKDLLLWAIGAATALCVYSARLQLKAGFERALGTIRKPQSKKSLVGILSGLGLATALLAVFVFPYIGLSYAHGWQPRQDRLMDGLLIFVLPEAAYMLAVSLLWKHKRSAALGVLIGAAILFTHVIIHHVTHG